MSSKRKRVEVRRPPIRPKGRVVEKDDPTLRVVIADIATPIVRDLAMDHVTALLSGTSPKQAHRDESPAVSPAQTLERLHARATAAAPADPPKIDQAVQGLEGLCKRLDQACGDLLVFNDSRLGAEPQDPAADGGSPPRIGQIGNVLDLIESAHRLTGRLEAELRRLRNL